MLKGNGCYSAPERQRIIRHIRRLSDQDLSRRAVAEHLAARGIKLSHVSVGNVLASTTRQGETA